MWLDIVSMKGQTSDAMSAAIEAAAVMIYGVCSAYKESANCRQEDNRAAQVIHLW